MREQGNVRRWDAAKGFGFIQGARSASVFFHIRDFRGSTPPAEGLRVSFEEIQVGGKGPRAMDVRPLAEAADGPAGLAALHAVAADPRLAGYQPFWAARAALAARAGQAGEAAQARRRAVGAIPAGCCCAG